MYLDDDVRVPAGSDHIAVKPKIVDHGAFGCDGTLPGANEQAEAVAPAA